MDLFNSIKKIPQGQLLGCLVLIGLLPVLVTAYLFWSDLDYINSFEYNLENVEELAMRVEKKQISNKATLNEHRNADHFYIDKQLETLTFLEPEVESLKKTAENPHFIEDEPTRKRLNFLTGKQNHLTFSESNVQSTPFFQEVTETLLYPVEINLQDLQKILTVVEGRDLGVFKTPDGRPQLLILDFKIEKKNIREENQVFDLNMKLLKREYP
ncbi:MAG: hypothetical protein H0W50_08155 [Parachlamydiaceae bacterium]|nr:hypothetical protein [Parachlamydiaceae bacterium]